MDGNHGSGCRLLFLRGNTLRKKLFRRIYNDDNIPDDELLHIFFDSSMLRLDIIAYDSDIYSAYSKFFDAFSQAKRRRIFPKDLASFIDSFLVNPKDFNVNNCHPFNTSNKNYYFNFEEDEDHIYIWLNVSLNFSRGDIFMDEKTNMPIVPQVPEETERIGAAQISDSQESSLDTANDTSSSDYVKAQGDPPVIDNSSTLPLEDKDLAEVDATLNDFQMVTSDTSGVAVVPAIISETPIASTKDDLSSMNLDSLTLEINQYLNIARYSVIEVGKRLILAKKLVPHGEWQNWLKKNFNLSYPTATKFMNIADRFSNVATLQHLDLLTFKPSQLIALLALPKGEEINFIETKAAEGMPVAEMSVKTLHSEIKKFSTNLTHDDSVSNHSSTAPASVPDTDSNTQETSIPISHTSSPQQADITCSSTPALDVDKTLAQLFAATSSLLNSDNLQSIVSSSADFDFPSFKQQLAQLASLQAELQKYLNVWEVTHINQSPIDRDVIIAELKQLALQDMKNLTSALLLALVKSFGYEDMSQVPDELLPDLLRKIKAFQFFLLNM